MGDFNVTVKNKFMIDLCELNDLSSLIDKPIEKPTCTDLILTNKTSCFQYRRVFETDLSNFHF